jgi:hypothetical protein
MDREWLISDVREMRARGRTPRVIAKALGITRAEAEELIRGIVREQSPGPRSFDLVAELGNMSSTRTKRHLEPHVVDPGTERVLVTAGAQGIEWVMVYPEPAGAPG